MTPEEARRIAHDIVAGFPPPTEEQKEQLRRLLSPYRPARPQQGKGKAA